MNTKSKALSVDEIAAAQDAVERETAIRAELLQTLRQALGAAQERISENRFLDAGYDSFHASLLCFMLMGFFPQRGDARHQFLSARMRNPAAPRGKGIKASLGLP